jgi:hypothetical protein
MIELEGLSAPAAPSFGGNRPLVGLALEKWCLFGVIRDLVEPISGQANCAVLRKRKFPEHYRLR